MFCKNIAISINTSWNIYNFRMNLIRSLQEEGYKIYAISPKDFYSKELERFGVEHIDIPINNKGTNPLEDLKTIYEYYKIYKELQPNVALHYTIKPNIYGTVGAKLADIPVINNISGLGTVFLNRGFSSKVAKILYRFSLYFSDKVFFQNNYDRELFIDLKLVNKRKTDLLPGSGIDTEKFSPIETVVKSDDVFYFLFIARLVKDKGLMEYIEAARRLKKIYSNVKFNILGAFYQDNPTAITPKEMNQWVDEGIVEYLGTTNDVKSAIAKNDCIVLPSYREGLSRVLLEAASMEKPIVTTDVPGCREVVEDGYNGYLCKVKDVESLFKAMEKMINLPKKTRVIFGKRGREKVKLQFDEKLVIDAYKNAIKLIGC